MAYVATIFLVDYQSDWTNMMVIINDIQDYKGNLYHHIKMVYVAIIFLVDYQSEWTNMVIINDIQENKGDLYHHVKMVLTGNLAILCLEHLYNQLNAEGTFPHKSLNHS